MKVSYSLNELYRAIGISKQAVSQYQQRQGVFDERMHQLILEAEEVRLEHPGCGVEKLYRTLNPDFIGRDRFVEMMMDVGFRLKKKKNYRRTTVSGRIQYPNLIKGMIVNGASQVWQSDITYIPIGDRHYYAVFIIDVYTKKIVGYKLSDHMFAEANIQALLMALKEHDPPWIHHSDRGSQYGYKGYTNLLESKGCKISMCTSAQDNAYAERINRTIKEEYLNYWRPQTYHQLKRMIKKAVDNYNNKRPHKHLGYLTPVAFEKQLSVQGTLNRKAITIFNNEIVT